MTRLSYNQRTTGRPDLPRGISYCLARRGCVRYMASFTVNQATYRAGPFFSVRDAEQAYAELKRKHTSS